jgi:hypothetical protein
MQLLVFVTDDGISPEGTGPILVIEEMPSAVLPPHPRSLSWKYFATVGLDDSLVAAERAAIDASVRDGRPYISSRLVFAPAE